MKTARPSLLVLPLLLLLSHTTLARHRKLHKRQAEPGMAVRPNITRLHIRSEVTLRYATTTVTSRVVNPAQRAMEVSFDIRLPKTAFITNFTMEIAGRNYSGSVKEKERANREYQQAVARGQSAAQVKKSPRGTDRFNVAVNVVAGGQVTFYLVYEELLKRKLGLYSSVIFVDPGQVVHDFLISVHVNESRQITELYAPPITASDTEADVTSLLQNQYAVMEFVTATEVRVTYQPPAAVQRENAETGLSGRFTVLYDVLRDYDGGEIQVVDGFFVHFFAPSGLQPLYKNVMFVLDTSGSMYGTKLAQVKDAMATILGELRQGDYFNVMRFSGSSSTWQTETAMVQASQENVNNALTYVRALTATGGTNVNDAVLAAINKLSEHSQSVENELSSMIIFLTDGDPTVGVTQTRVILGNVYRLNEGRFPIYSLGFGQSVNFKFLKRISLQNSGFARKIYEDSDAGLQLTGFFREVSTPLLNDVTFDYLGEVNETAMSRRTFPIYYNGSEIVVVGCLLPPPQPKSQTVQAVVYARSKTHSVNWHMVMNGTTLPPRWPIRPPMPVLPPRQPPKHKPGKIERLWAYMTIQQYLDNMLATTDASVKANYKRKALELSLKYSFVTDLTSMVVVKPNQTDSLPSGSRGGRRPNPQATLNHHVQSRKNFSPTRHHSPPPRPAIGLSGPRGRSGSRGSSRSHPSSSGSGPIRLPTQRLSRPAQDLASTAESESSPNRRFGYSFVDGDPHVLVTVPGNNSRPLCFNIRGEPNATYLLLADPANDVNVTGRLIHGERNRRYHGRRSYFGQIRIHYLLESNPDLLLTVTPHTVTLGRAAPISWEQFNATLLAGRHPQVRMPSRHLLKVQLRQSAVLVVARHIPAANSRRHSTAYVGFHVESIGLLSGSADGIIGQFAHALATDLSTGIASQLRYTPQGGAASSTRGAPTGTRSKMLRFRLVTRRNLVSKVRVECMFVDRPGRDLLNHSVAHYKIRATK